MSPKHEEAKTPLVSVILCLVARHSRPAVGA